MEITDYKLKDIWRIKHMIEHYVELSIEERAILVLFIETALDLAFKEFMNK